MNKQIQTLNVSETAREKISEIIKSTKNMDQGVRIRMENNRIELMFSSPEDRTENDLIQNTGEFDIVMDTSTAELLEGASVDIENGNIAINPAPGKNLFPTTREWGEPVADAVQHVIDQQLNPGLASHGGWVKLLSVNGDTALIEMGGGCKGCMHSYMTLKDTIERTIVDTVPEIKKVVDQTDHEDGSSPYYATN